jgi:hypothetical protein
MNAASGTAARETLDHGTDLNAQPNTRTLPGSRSRRPFIGLAASRFKDASGAAHRAAGLRAVPDPATRSPRTLAAIRKRQTLFTHARPTLETRAKPSLTRPAPSGMKTARASARGSQPVSISPVR